MARFELHLLTCPHGKPCIACETSLRLRRELFPEADHD